MKQKGKMMSLLEQLQVLDRGRKVAAVGRRCGVNESAIGLKET
jgi:hypothetical protein